MHSFRHVTANYQALQEWSFGHEVFIQAYLMENPNALAFSPEFVDNVQILGSQLTINNAECNGRLDLLVGFGNEYLAIVEIKKGRLSEAKKSENVLAQLELYLEHRKIFLQKILEDHKGTDFTDRKWLGIIVGASIDPQLVAKLQAGQIKLADGILPIAITVKRYRAADKDAGNFLVFSDFYYNEKTGKDYTKYRLDGQDMEFGKGRLVLEVIKSHVRKHPGISLDALQKDFSDTLQGSVGVVRSIDVAKAYESSSGQKRFYSKSEDLIELKNHTIVVSNQWGKGNIERFIEHARVLGFTINEVLSPK
ncbi:hypothetical protein [Desulfocurvibacter africanus]|uniref:DUF91 domain-containing protein n=1 Tax=Desulfocurvibacter africanus subsp. africanus str. Walvis Bay TaxID=690850 RepID=F3YXJ5_DESAF|nr:hypothetical protein [Desulfocurvibacter africanus]EGJ51772.1 hypothetical protein Desaf_3488 [Desulfocurvibacter africanus subsp. africanus str. Walvis Bay]